MFTKSRRNTGHIIPYLKHLHYIWFEGIRKDQSLRVVNTVWPCVTFKQSHLLHHSTSTNQEETIRNQYADFSSQFFFRIVIYQFLSCLRKQVFKWKHISQNVAPYNEYHIDFSVCEINSSLSLVFSFLFILSFCMKLFAAVIGLLLHSTSY